MKKMLKYGVVPVVVGAFLLSLTLMLLPVLINVQKFLPEIEKQITKTTGRSFSVGSDFGLTFFPWLSVTFSDMRLGNPEGFIAEDFIQIDSFEARVKLLPLLANKVEVSRFVVSGLNVNLQREQNGENNWESFSLAKQSGSNLSSKLSRLFSKEYYIELFAVTGGSITLNDRQQGVEQQIDDLMIMLYGISPLKTARIDFKAKGGGYQVRAAGNIGPISSYLSSLDMDMRLQVNDSLQGIVKGECTYPLGQSQCNLQVNIPAFLLSDMYSSDEVENNSESLTDEQSIELGGHFIGNLQKFSVDAGSGVLGDAPFTYRLTHDPEKDIVNDIELNFKRIDFDRYFTGGKAEIDREKSVAECPVLKLLQSSPHMINIRAGKAQLARLQLSNVSMQVNAKDDVMSIKNGVFELYGGSGQFDAEIVLSDQPVSLESRIKLQQVETESFSKELTGVPFLSGPMKGNIALKTSGLPGNDLGKGLVGSGNIQIDDGTISGINLFLHESSNEEKMTEFNKLSADIIIGSGVVRMHPLVLLGVNGITEMSAEVQLADKSFSVSPDGEKAEDESLSVSGSYGPQGLEILGFTDVHETKIHELRDAQTLVDEKMPQPVAEDVNSMVGTPLIDPAIVAQRFGLKPETITPDKSKKAYSVGKGRVRINTMQLLDAPDFLK